MQALPAEYVYLFRHALMRDAAYALQTPSTRAQMHAIALEVIEDLVAGNPALREESARELADHALFAADGPSGGWRARELEYLHLAAKYAQDRYRDLESVQLNQRISQHPEATPAQASRALFRQGHSHERLARLAEAKGCFAAAQASAQAAGDAGFASEAVLRLAPMLVADGRLPEAAVLAKEAIAVYERLGDDSGRANALGVYAYMRFAQGDPVEAEKCIREAIALFEAVGDRSGRITTSRRLMFWLATSRRLPEAIAIAEEVLAASRQHEGPDRVAGALLDYAMVVTASSDWKRSIELASQALEGFRAVGNHHDAIRALSHVAGGVRMSGNYEHAEALTHQVLELAEEVDAPGLKRAAWGNLGGLCKRSGRLAEAEKYYLLLMREQRAVGDVRVLGHIGGNYAELLHMQGRMEEAEQAYREALQALEAGVDLHVQAVHRGRFAVLLADLGRMEEAAPLYRQCLEALQAHGDQSEAQKARDAMAKVCERRGFTVPSS